VWRCAPGRNCKPGNPVPQTCQVGCALVFPQFLEACRPHIKAKTDAHTEKAFEAFEKKCLDLDGIALIQYALGLVKLGCKIDLGSGHGSRRRLQFLNQYVDSTSKTCPWDQINDQASAVDKICCGANGASCPHHQAPKGKCSPACAAAVHAFTTDCAETLAAIMPAANDKRKAAIFGFEKTCVAGQDPKFFVKAIMAAKCPKGVKKPHGPVPPRPATTSAS